MTSSYKSKVRMTQQYQQTVQVKQVSHLETLKVFHGCDPPGTANLNLPPSFVLPPNITEKTKHIPIMSTEWKTLPFAFPVTEENRQKAEKINDVLTFSMRQQKEDEISDNAGFVVILVSRCLNAVGIDNQINSGYRHIEGESSPHLWLIIEGYIIDNTYIKEFQKHSIKYLCKKTPKCYETYDFSDPKNILPNLKTIDMFGITYHLMKRHLDFCIRMPDRALALSLNREQSYNYYFAMVRHMYDAYGTCIAGIDPKIRFMCWCCECYPSSGRNFISDIVSPCDFNETITSSKITWKFSHCSQCMVANYCSQQCQRKDWMDNHSVNCLSRGSVYLPPLDEMPYTSEFT